MSCLHRAEETLRFENNKCPSSCLGSTTSESLSRHLSRITSTSPSQREWTPAFKSRSQHAAVHVTSSSTSRGRSRLMSESPNLRRSRSTSTSRPRRRYWTKSRSSGRSGPCGSTSSQDTKHRRTSRSRFNPDLSDDSMSRCGRRQRSRSRMRSPKSGRVNSLNSKYRRFQNKPRTLANHEAVHCRSTRAYMRRQSSLYARTYRLKYLSNALNKFIPQHWNM